MAPLKVCISTIIKGGVLVSFLVIRTDIEYSVVATKTSPKPINSFVFTEALPKPIITISPAKATMVHNTSFYLAFHEKLKLLKIK